MNYKKGQVLLITIMLLATVVTVTLAVTLKSTTETQTTKLEEESQKALAAAEAAVEAALTKGSITSFLGLNVPAGFTGQASVTTNQDIQFVSPLLQKDQQYTLYLSTPLESPPGVYHFDSLTSAYNSQSITICFGETGYSSPALELSFLKSTNTVSRMVVNPSSSTVVAGGGTLLASSPASNCPSGPYSFTQSYTIPDVGGNNLLLIVRVLSPSSTQTRLGFKGSSPLPAQGKNVTSEAKSPTGVTKKVTLFQSYPQIPSNFFTTMF